MRASIAAVFVAALAGCSIPVTGPEEGPTSASASALTPSTSIIDEFHEVSPGISRGARPHDAGLSALAAAGFRTVLDLENDMPVVDAERATAEQLGLTFISKPMSPFWAPDDASVNEILAILADRTRRPIFIHCEFGQDRTGLIIGLHRVLAEGWAPRAAYDEMRQLGFHRVLIFLNHYYEERTGFED